jgi:hypothetical protein
MHILHEHEQVQSRVSKGLHEAGSYTLAVRQAHGIPLDAIVSQLTLFGRQPAGGKWRVWQQEYADNGHADGHNT